MALNQALLALTNLFQQLIVPLVDLNANRLLKDLGKGLSAAYDKVWREENKVIVAWIVIL